MDIIIGSARIGENGKATGGAKGDQKQNGSSDYVGEVSMQKFYNHKKGWLVIRPKSDRVALKIAEGMKVACNNANIGYNQNERLGVIKDGAWSTKKTNADCSSLVRACCIYAGINVGNFTTLNEQNVLEATGAFEPIFVYSSSTRTPLKTGDILCTCSKGHTAIVVEGNPREASKFYPKYEGSSCSIVSVLKELGETDTSFPHRKDIALNNGFTFYSGTSDENNWLVGLAKAGTLKRA